VLLSMRCIIHTALYNTSRNTKCQSIVTPLIKINQYYNKMSILWCWSLSVMYRSPIWRWWSSYYRWRSPNHRWGAGLRRAPVQFNPCSGFRSCQQWRMILFYSNCLDYKFTNRATNIQMRPHFRPIQVVEYLVRVINNEWCVCVCVC